MEKQAVNNIRLGLFVLAGIFTLIFALYAIGKNRSFFGSDFELKVHFSNLNGLMKGNNVLYSGIQAGTVKTTALKNDTTIEVTLLINKKIKDFIHKNAIASISTEGLMGNKIVNILPGKGQSPKVDNGDLLASHKTVNTDELLNTVSITNDNVSAISALLKNIMLRINNSELLNFIDDGQQISSLKASLTKFGQTTKNTSQLTHQLVEIVGNLKKGKGAAGTLLADTTAENNLKEILLHIRLASSDVKQVTSDLKLLTTGLNKDLNTENGAVRLLLKDSVTANNIRLSIDHIRKGTEGFNQNMEALKHNFLFRGYFKKLNRQQKKQ